MLMFVGLGNPGPKYQLNRHNIGFMLIDVLARRFNAAFKSEHKAEVARIRPDSSSEEILLVKPQTYMNLSGESVLALQTFYKLGKGQLLVAHDEVDLPFGTVRMQFNRGHGGNNGIRNIHSLIGPEYARLRMGVGRPTIPQMDVASYVLQNFSEAELDAMPPVLENSMDAALLFAEVGFHKAQTHVNAQ